MKIAISKTLLEPGTIPWENIIRGAEKIEIEKLVNAVLDEAANPDVDIRELMNTLAERIRENSNRSLTRARARQRHRK